MGIRLSNRKCNSSDIVKNGFGFVKSYFANRKGKFFILFLSIILGIVVNSITPYLYGKMIDSIVRGDIGKLKIIIGIFLLLNLSAVLFSVFESIFGVKLSMLTSNEIKSGLFNKILWMKSKNQDKYSTGELINRLEGDADSIVGYYIDFLTSSLMIIINLVVSIGFLVKISSKLTIVAMLFLPFSYLVNFCFRNKIKRLSSIQKETEDENYKYIALVFNNLKNTKILQIEKAFSSGYKIIKDKQYKILEKSTYLSSLIKFLQQVINQLFEITIIFISALLIVSGRLSIGNMVSFNSYLEKLFSAISKMLSLNLNKQSLQVSLGRMGELEKIELESNNCNLEVINIKKIQFVNVYFRYSEKDIILNMNFIVDEPGLYSFVGENGVGKTTILKIVSKLYEKHSGKVVINEREIEELEVAVIRNSISYMMKDTIILPESLIDNLTLGINYSVDKDKICDICKKVQLEDLVEKIGGYGEIINAEMLSSGEKQKIGLARVFLKKSKLILLDEVTSDLDGFTEKCIISMFNELSKDAIIINVCHRKDLVISSKQIFVISNGGILEKGNHMELIRKRGLYYKLFDYNNLK